MFRILIVLALTLSTGFAVAQPVETESSTNRSQRCPASVDTGELNALRLNGEGHCVVRFETERAALFLGEVFSSPSASGEITVMFRPRGGNDDEDAEKVAVSVYPPGRYEAVIQAENPGSAVVQFRVGLGRPTDDFEPNNLQSEAFDVDLPFAGIVHLSNGDADWFRIDPEPGGVIGIHLHTGYSYTGPHIGVYDRDGTEILITAATDWGVRGMRYVRSTGRPMFIAVWDTVSWGERDGYGYKTLEIVQYRPLSDPASARSLVTLGLEGEDPAFFQLDLIGEAIGVETVQADEAAEIARELAAAIQGRGMSFGTIMLWVLAALILGLVALSIWWQRHRIGQIATRAATTDEPDKPSETD